MSKSEVSEKVLENLKDGPLDVYKFRWLFIGISLLFLIPGIYFLIANTMNPEIQAPLRLGIDFKGGTLFELGFSKPVAQQDVNNIRTVFDQHGYTGAVIQIQQPRAGINKSTLKSEALQPAQKVENNKTENPEKTPPEKISNEQVTAKNIAPQKSEVGTNGPETSNSIITTNKPTASNDIATLVSIRSKHIKGQDDVAILNDLQKQYGHITLLQKNSMGPALAQELLTNGALALVLAYLLIVGYLTVRFQFDFAVCAMLALVHDTIFLFGMFAMFGALFHTEVDSLFVTAVLTVVGFSVHDTIVVFDRIRENGRLLFTKKVPFTNIVNMSVNQTLARSINTSLTVLLTMLAMYFFGGETTKDFVLAIIIGIAAGTYSSIFNASVLLAMWRNRAQSAQQKVAA